MAISKKQLRTGLLLLPAIISGGAVFVFLSGVYYHGFTFGLSMLFGPIQFHQHLSLVDYTVAAIRLLSDPVILVSLIFVFQLMRHFMRPRGLDLKPNPTWAPALLATVRRIGVVSAIAIIALAIVLHALVPQDVLDLFDLKSARFYWQAAGLFLVTTAGLGVLYFLAFKLMEGVATTKPPDRHANDADARGKHMRRIRNVGAIGIPFVVIAFAATAFQPLVAYGFVALMVGTFACFWIPLMDQSYGYRVIRHLASDPLRTLVTLAPLAIPLYWAVGYLHAHNLVRENTVPQLVSTKSMGTIEADWYKGFDKWMLIACWSNDVQHLMWVPLHETTRIEPAARLAGSERQSASPTDHAEGCRGAESAAR